MREIDSEMHQLMVEKHGRRVGFEIKRLSHIMVRGMLCKLREYNMDETTMMNGWILKYLCDHEGNDVFQRDIEKECGIGKSSVTSIVKQMEKQGFIVREQVPGDARLKKLCITDKGRKTDDRIREVFDRADELASRGISEEDLRVFYSVVDRIYQNIAQDLCDGCRGRDLDSASPRERSAEASSVNSSDTGNESDS